MNTPESIRELAWKRIEEAKILCKNDKIEGAYYLAGYSFELMLKAAICSRIGMPNLFDEEDRNANAIDGISDVRRAVKTHNLGSLLLLSGIRNEFNLYWMDSAKSRTILSEFSLNWSEACRYKPIGYINQKTVEAIIFLLSNEQGVLKWIEKRM